jgi:ElaB/YqjD/DUF883 family membrane-anchored ribosome-binding protein
MDEATNQISAAADSDANTEQLRADIEDTRADMSQTINEIQERLSPEHLVGQVKETVREATIGKVERVANKVGETISGVAEPAREMAGRAGNVIKEVGTSVGNIVSKNPIPLALIGLGVGMLVMKNTRGQSYGNSSSSRRSLQGQRSNYAMGDVGQPRQMQQQQSAGPGTLNQVKETASDLASRSTEAVSNFGTRVGEMMRENPLACGAVAVAAGTAIGLVLPSTRFENEYIGETGERLVERVEDIARDALGRVQDAAKPAEPVTA